MKLLIVLIFKELVILNFNKLSLLIIMHSLFMPIIYIFFKIFFLPNYKR